MSVIERLKTKYPGAHALLPAVFLNHQVRKGLHASIVLTMFFIRFNAELYQRFFIFPALNKIKAE
ncbi:hypothetical protein [Buttiauxella massiliensis]|uniref:hypothetical protein n=1 Tax=Buttiauxella massiliensis TaxID=2831590 RepID=UPI00125F9D9F|nr:hypothetical protein [Buttiauxella massiliensis]